MDTAAGTPAPTWFRLVTLTAVLWNAFGVAMYLSSVGVFRDPMAGMTDPERTAASSIPSWITGVFAIGTFTGLIGSVGLLLRKRRAKPVLIVSLIALVVLEGWIVFFSGALEQFGLAVPVMVSVGAIMLAWLATYARTKGWLS